MIPLPGDVDAQRMRGLRTNCFAATVALLIEYGLGMWANLYGHLPASDHGATVLSGIARAISNGPVGLSLHALLGLVLIVSAGTALVRAVLVRARVLITLAGVALVAILAAAMSGATFVGHGNDAASMTMAIAAAIAIAAYVIVLFVTGGARASHRS